MYKNKVGRVMGKEGIHKNWEKGRRLTERKVIVRRLKPTEA